MLLNIILIIRQMSKLILVINKMTEFDKIKWSYGSFAEIPY